MVPESDAQMPAQVDVAKLLARLDCFLPTRDTWEAVAAEVRQLAAEVEQLRAGQDLQLPSKSGTIITYRKDDCAGRRPVIVIDSRGGRPR